MNAILDSIKEARQILGVRERWCQFAYGRDAENKGVEARSPEAIKWCLTGILLKLCDNNLYRDVYETLRKINNIPGGLCGFNDDSSYEDVIAALDHTIDTIELDSQ